MIGFSDHLVLPSFSEFPDLDNALAFFVSNQHQTKPVIQYHSMSAICNIIKKAKSLPTMRFFTKKRQSSPPKIEPPTSQLSPTPIRSQPEINTSSPESSDQLPPPLIVITPMSIPSIRVTPPDSNESYPFISFEEDFSDLFWRPDNQLECN